MSFLAFLICEVAISTTTIHPSLLISGIITAALNLDGETDGIKCEAFTLLPNS